MRKGWGKGGYYHFTLYPLFYLIYSYLFSFALSFFLLLIFSSSIPFFSLVIYTLSLSLLSSMLWYLALTGYLRIALCVIYYCVLGVLSISLLLSLSLFCIPNPICLLVLLLSSRSLIISRWPRLVYKYLHDPIFWDLPRLSAWYFFLHASRILLVWT